MADFEPTDEQMQALGMFTTGRSLKVEAGAGTGKTATLRLLAESTDRLGQYLAFNRALVEDGVASMPVTLDCSTIHSLAFRALGHRYAPRLNADRMKPWDLARLLGIDHAIVVRYNAMTKVLQPGFLAGLVMRGITNFCNSDEAAPSVHHLPLVKAIDPPEPGAHDRRYPNNERLRSDLEPALMKAWSDLSDVDGSLPVTHAHYLKMYERSEPLIAKDYLLLDEAQDLNPVMLSIAAQQGHAQTVLVGDTQQQIYGWMGAINALARSPIEHRTFLTRSFRFGPAIAEVANAVLDELDAELRLVGSPSVDSTVRRVAAPRAVLCRTNAVAVETVVSLQKGGKNPYLVGGGDEVLAFAKAAERLQDGEKPWHPDLACFDSWSEVQSYVKDDPQGDELRLLVRLVDEYGTDTIREALEQMPAERRADVIVSTAHKAKGREWPSVRIAGDFPFPDDGAGAEEWRLLYVAVTRAREQLDVSSCGPVLDLMGAAQDPLPFVAPVA